MCPCGTTCTFWARIYLCHPGLRRELRWKRSELSQWRLPETSKQRCLQITQRESKLPQLQRLQEDDTGEAAVSPRRDFHESGTHLSKRGGGNQAPHTFPFLHGQTSRRPRQLLPGARWGASLAAADEHAVPSPPRHYFPKQCQLINLCKHGKSLHRKTR